MKIHPKLFLWLSPTFILFTIIGTLSHEYGHILIARNLGYKTTLHYASMNYDRDSVNDKLNDIVSHHIVEIRAGQPFSKETEYKGLVRKMRHGSLWITIGGPFQTILTGLAGLSLLLFRRKKFRQQGFKTIDWLAVFLSLFWLREVCNLVLSVGSGIIEGNGKYFGGDENNINQLLHLPPGLIPVLMGVLGLLISAFVVLFVVPREKRLTFICAGFIGGACGYLLWMNLAGPWLLP